MIKKLVELLGVTKPSTFCPGGRTCAFTGHRPQNLPFREYSGRFYTPIPEIGNHRSDMKETAIPF